MKLKKKALVAFSLALCVGLTACITITDPDSESISSAAVSSEVASESVETTASESVASDSLPDASETSNLLLRAPTYEHPILNGFGERIGTVTEVYTDKDIVKSLTAEEFAEFVDSFVANSDSDSIVVNMNDGTCINFSGGYTASAYYAEMADNYSVKKVLKNIIRNQDGLYEIME